MLRISFNFLPKKCCIIYLGFSKNFESIFFHKFRLESNLESSYLQFLSNVFRHNQCQAKQILESMVRFYLNDSLAFEIIKIILKDSLSAFCRKLTTSIKENNKPKLFLYAFTILLKLRYETVFSVMNRSIDLNIIQQIDLAMKFLSEDETSVGQQSRKHLLAEKCQLRINSLIFLDEFLKCEPVLKFLEKCVIFLFI